MSAKELPERRIDLLFGNLYVELLPTSRPLPDGYHWRASWDIDLPDGVISASQVHSIYDIANLCESASPEDIAQLCNSMIGAEVVHLTPPRAVAYSETCADQPLVFVCALCGEVAEAWSYKQKKFAESSDTANCYECFLEKARANRLAQREAAARALGEAIADQQIDAGEFDVAAVTGGFVYQFVDVTGEVLYIGSTGRPLYERLASHKTKHWYPDASVVTWRRYESLDAAQRAERLLIQTQNPTYNIQHNQETA